MSGEEGFLAALGADDEYDPAAQPTVASEDEEDYEPEDEFPASDIPKPNPEYDPATYTNPTLRDDHNETPDDPSPTKQPKTRAGFVVDDDDDEDEEQGDRTAHGDVNGNGMLDAGQAPIMSAATVTQSPSNAFSANYVSQQQAAPQDSVRSAAGTPVVPSQSATPRPVDTPLSATDRSQAPSVAVNAPSQSPAGHAAALNAAAGRLPSDHVGMLEDRVADDPRGDLDAWLALIQLHQKRNKLDEARKVYERFFAVFPHAAEQWVAYANMELENNEIPRVTQILGTSLAKVKNVQLWKVYLDFVRRFNNLTTDPTGTARRTVSEAFERVLQEIGGDKDSGEIWREYIQFLRSGPGTLGGGGWQDQQKMDLLRKAYQRATAVPTDAVIPLWKEYDAFETGLNRTTGRKILQERSPTYITARSANIALQNVTNGLKRTSLPRLPPALGFDGDVEYMEQVQLWQKWVEWEKEDPLVIKDEDLAAYNRRILYVYKQALMALWFWPPMWYDAIEFCFQNGLKEDGEKLLDDGTSANPESCLLAFRKADYVEMTTPHADGDDGVQKRADAIKAPYDQLLDALYGLVDKVKAREARAASIAKEHFEDQQRRDTQQGDDDDEDAGTRQEEMRKAALDAQLDAIKKGHAAQIKMISRTVSFSWIALMRAMRRVQGKGKMVDVTHKGSLVKKEWVGGLRGFLREARSRGRMTSDVFVASALMEYHCYKDPASKRIFDAGFKLFPEDEQFALAYMKHLINTNDVTNARAVFETAVSKLTKKPENVHKAKVLFQFLHEYECQYGELSQIVKLEQRMADLFPEDPRLARFTSRYTFQSFDPTAVRLITSPATQMRPKMTLPPPLPDAAIPGVPTHRAPTPQPNSPRPLPVPLAASGQSPAAHAPAYLATAPSINSPKRPLPADESDNDSIGIGARKLARTERSESPLKGAAGRRLDAQRRLGAGGGGTPGAGNQRAGPEPLPNMVMFLLGILPNAEKYQGSARFSAERVVELLRGVDLSRANTSGGKRW